MISGDIVVLRPAAQNVPPGVALPAGPQGRPGQDGAPGTPGSTGQPGQPGKDGITQDISGKLDKTGDASGTNVTPAGLSSFSALTSDLFGIMVPRVVSNAALKTFALPFTRVRRDGFATAGDGGAVEYTYSTTAPTPADNGAVVKSTALPGYWVADFGPSADIRAWGARQGQNIDDALDAAITWAAKTHVPLVIPYPTGGQQYLVARSHVIGNGSATQLSTINNVTLRVIGASGDAASGTAPPTLLPFRYTGSTATDIPFIAQGPATGIKFEGIGVDCAGVCATGIKINNIINGEFGWLAVQGHTGPGIVCTVVQNNTWFGSLEGCQFHDWWVTVPGAGGCGLQLGDDTWGGTGNGFAVIANTFDNITINWDSTNAACWGIKLGMATECDLFRVRSTYDPVRGGTNGVPLKISPPPGDHGYPCNIHFNGAYFSGVADPGPTTAGWAPYSGQGIRFTGFSTLGGPFPVATTYGNYTGTDSAGVAYPGPASWTPVDGSGAGLAFTVQSATYTKRGKDIIANVALTFPTTANGSPAVIGGLPFAAEAGGVSRFGGIVTYTDVGTPITLLIGDNTKAFNVYNYSGGATANSSLSGKSIRATFIYRSN